MRIAVISDIHGNLEALDTVLQDIEKKSIDKILVCGDLAVAGPDPSAVMDCLINLSKTRDTAFILGNTDEMILKANEKEGVDYFPPNETMKAAVKYTQSVLRDDQLDFLALLPEKFSITIGQIKILLTHGSPRSINENITPDLDEKTLKQMIQGHDEDIILCGHTHLPVIYNLNSQYVVNAGSVGRPFTEKPYACYAIIDYPDLNSKKVLISHRFLQYDTHKTAEKFLKAGFYGCDRLKEVILSPQSRHDLF